MFLLGITALSVFSASFYPDPWGDVLSIVLLFSAFGVPVGFLLEAVREAFAKWEAGG
jgi:hypothetical protein